MRIGIFTDTYAPQISGVCTSILTLQSELEKLGHTVYIFTTTDPLLTPELEAEESDKIVRLRSVPFVSMPERRFVMVGLPTALSIVRNYDLDVIHTQTEFGVGILGKIVANRLQIPVIHTMHTKYEDYLHYIAGGHLIKPSAVKYVMRSFLLGTEAVICPSPMTEEQVRGYGVKAPIRVIPTGIEVNLFKRPEITKEDTDAIREQYGISEHETVILSLSRLSMEKNIQAVIRALPNVVKYAPVRLLIVGHGPYQEELEKLVKDLHVEDYVNFVGPIENDETAVYYKAADFFISASTSETQGLTFTESLAAGTPILAARNPYLETLVTDNCYGRLFNHEGAIAETILDAISDTPEMTEEAYEEKCYEISATAFGKRVEGFYEEMIELYKERPTVLSNITDPAKEITGRSVKTVKKAQFKVRRRSRLFAKKVSNYVRINKKEKELD